MKTLYLMVGCPGSGKSFYAKYYLQDENTHIVSRDEIRFSLLEEKDNYFAKEDEVFKIFVNKIKEELNNGFNVIADATHLNKRSRVKLLSHLHLDTDEVEVIPIVMRTPLDICIKRNDTRKGTRAYVPPASIADMYDNCTKPDFEEYGGIFTCIRFVPYGGIK